MANSIYKKMYNNRKKSKTSTSSNSSYDMAKQISNYETRLNAVDKKKDSRNPIEKFLGLPEDQNVLFDIFELIGRPQQAIFGAIESAQQGENPLVGAKEGLTGEKFTYGGDILRNMGVSDDTLFTLFGNDVSLSDIGGTALDIFADPVDAAIWGSAVATGGATAPIAISKAGLEAAQTGNKSLKLVNTASDVAKGINAVGDFSKANKVLSPLEVMIEKPVLTKIKKSTLEKGAELLGKTTKKAAGTADNLITKGLLKADTKAINNLMNEALEMGKNTDNIQFHSLLNDYNAIKKAASNTLDYSKSLPNNIMKNIMKSDNSIDLGIKESNKIIQGLIDEANNYVFEKIKREGLDPSQQKELFSVLSREINDLIESGAKTDFTGTELLKSMIKKGNNVIEGTEESLMSLKSYLDTIPGVEAIIDDKSKNLVIKTKGQGRTLIQKALSNNDELAKLDNIKVVKDLGYNEEQLKYIDGLKTRYADDKQFRTLVDNAKGAYGQIADIMSKATNKDISFREIADLQGYVRRSVNPELKGMPKVSDAGTTGSKKVLSDRKYKEPAIVANRSYAEDIAKKKERKTRLKQSLENSLFENKEAQLASDISKTKDEISALDKKFEANMAKKNASIQEQKELKKILDNKRDNLSKVVTDEVIKLAEKTNKPKLIDDLSNELDNIGNYKKELSDIRNKLTKQTLEKSEVNSLVKQAKKLDKDLTKATHKVEINVEKVKNSIDKNTAKQAKLASKEVDRAIDLTNRGYKKDAKINRLSEARKNLEKGYNNELERLQKKQRKLEIEYGALNKENDKDILKQIGQLEKDIEVLSSKEGKDLFVNDFFMGISDFVNITANQSKALKRYNSTLLSSLSHDDNYIKFIGKDDVIGKVPFGYKKISKEEANIISSKLDFYKHVLNEDDTTLKVLKDKIKNSEGLIVDKNIYNLIKNDFRTEELNPLLNMLNRFNNTFKKFSTFTPGFHLRNISGNFSNMYLSGVPMNKIPGLYNDAKRLTDKKYFNTLLTKSVDGTLSKSELKDFNLIKEFIQNGFFGKGQQIQELGEIVEKTKNISDKNVISRVVDNIFKGSNDLNNYVDSINRMALFKYAKEQPSYLAKLGINNASDAVKHVLFDPSNLSPFEQNVAKKIIPFYTFTKQNLVFQAQNIMKNTSKYNRLVKAFNKTYQGVGENKYRQYQKENFEIPIPGLTDEKGNVTTLKSNLPLSDFGEYLSNPLQRLVAGTNPLIKAPFEITSGKNMFTGADLDTNPLEYLLSMAGLQGVTTNQIAKVPQLLNDDATINQKLAQLFPSIFRYNDQEKIANSNMYNELMEYQALVSELKKQGIDVPTISDLTSSSKSTLRKLTNERNKIRNSNR